MINKKLANWFNESRNNWKKRALEKQEKLREAQIKIRDLQRSREHWQKKAKENQKKAQETEQKYKVQQKKGGTLAEKKVEKHHYSLKEMAISVKQVIIGCNSFKGVQKNREIEITEEIEDLKEIKTNQHRKEPILAKNTLKKSLAPNYNTIRQWMGRIGLYELQKSREIRVDRTWIIDFSLELGTEKCLVILGVSQEYLLDKVWKEKRGLQHQEVEVLHIEIMKSTRGELIKDVFDKLREKVGKPRQIVSDQGSDLSKGIKLYQEKNQEVICTYDITHKLALLLKKELKFDLKYQSYVQKCNQCRQELQQTELAFLRPPAQRSKSRYLNLDDLIDWGKKIILYLKKERSIEEKERLDIQKIHLKMKWLLEYEEVLKTWHLMLMMSRGIESQLKKEGLHHLSLLEFKQTFLKFPWNSRLNNFQEEIIKYLQKESSVIEGKNPILASSDIIESIFGKYKFFSNKGPLKQIRRTILIIPLVTINITRDFVKEALENIKNIDLKKWEEEIFGQSMLSKRRILFARKSAGTI
jgi:hypothetical protein